MNSKALYGTGLLGIAGLAAVLLAGCGDSSTPDPNLTGTTGTKLHGQQTLIIHIPGMGKRLKLM
jgi:hypothetical protein